MHILDIGDSAQTRRFVAQERCGEAGQRGVLAAVDAQFAAETALAGDSEKRLGVGAHTLTVAGIPID